MNAEFLRLLCVAFDSKPGMILKYKLAELFDNDVVNIQAVSGGSVAAVYRVELDNGRAVIAKFDESLASRFELEATMLEYLLATTRLPVPKVLYSDQQLLVQELLPGTSRFTPAAQEHAAELLAELHSITSPAFGFEWDTLIGGLHQPNPRTRDWLVFFRDHRLMYMARAASEKGHLPSNLMVRLESLCAHLSDWIETGIKPALIHGDAWTGNILALPDRITGFLDPAIYYADPEIELAFTTLFGTFGNAFFDRYNEIHPIRPGFMEERRHLYNLYPLLVHVCLFGGSYVHSVDQVLKRFGY